MGIVVPDLSTAMDHFGGLLGLIWGPVVTVPNLALRDAAGNDTEVANACCYSTEPPYLELIQEVPGSPWECNGHSNLHHIGFFTADLPASSGQLTAGGCPLQVCGRDGAAAPTSFAYHRGDAGVRVELVDEHLRPAMAEWMFVPAPPAVR